MKFILIIGSLFCCNICFAETLEEHYARILKSAKQPPINIIEPSSASLFIQSETRLNNSLSALAAERANQIRIQNEVMIQQVAPFAPNPKLSNDQNWAASTASGVRQGLIRFPLDGRPR